MFTVENPEIVSPAKAPRPRLLLADDHNILLEGVRKLLESNFEIVGVAGDGREAVTLAETLRPDIVVLDIGLPLLNGIDAARQIRERAPQSRIVMLTQQTGKPYIRKAFEAGATAYVVKQSASRELSGAIDQAMRGERYVSESIRDVVEPSVAENNVSQPAAELTVRQREVLQLVAEGKTAKEIAVLLGISPKTVEFHKAAISDQLGLRTIAELTRYAVQQGLVND